MTFVVTLREGLKWSDGSALTAADFEYSWKRAASEATAADYGYMFAGFEGYPNDLAVTATDDTTLEFTLTAPCAYMEDLMAFPTFYPVKQSAVEAADGWETSPGAWCQNAGFVSNGPFVCTEWNHDTSMTYEKNPYWYGADDVELEKMEFMLSADDTAIYAAYNSGDVDMIDTVPNDEIQSLLSNPEFHIVDNLGTYYAAFNANSPIFEGKTPEQAAFMRKAMNILIDREYICGSSARPASSMRPLRPSSRESTSTYRPFSSRWRYSTPFLAPWITPFTLNVFPPEQPASKRAHARRATPVFAEILNISIILVMILVFV